MLVPEGNHPFLTRTCDSRSGLIVQVVNDGPGVSENGGGYPHDVGNLHLDMVQKWNLTTLRGS